MKTIQDNLEALMSYAQKVNQAKEEKFKAEGLDKTKGIELLIPELEIDNKYHLVARIYNIPVLMKPHESGVHFKSEFTGLYNFDMNITFKAFGYKCGQRDWAPTDVKMFVEEFATYEFWGYSADSRSIGINRDKKDEGYRKSRILQSYYDRGYDYVEAADQAALDGRLK